MSNMKIIQKQQDTKTSTLNNDSILALKKKIQIQNLYNQNAKEEREVIFFTFCKLKENFNEKSNNKRRQGVTKNLIKKDSTMIRDGVYSKNKDTKNLISTINLSDIGKSLENLEKTLETIALITFASGKFYFEIISIEFSTSKIEFLISQDIHNIKSIKSFDSNEYAKNFIKEDGLKLNQENDNNVNSNLSFIKSSKLIIKDSFKDDLNKNNQSNKILFYSFIFENNQEIVLQFLEEKIESAKKTNVSTNQNTLSFIKESANQFIDSDVSKLLWVLIKLLQYLNNPASLINPKKNTKNNDLKLLPSEINDIIKKYFYLSSKKDNLSNNSYINFIGKQSSISVELTNINFKNIEEIGNSFNYYEIHEIFTNEKNNKSKYIISDSEANVLNKVFKELKVKTDQNNKVLANEENKDRLKLTDFDYESLSMKIHDLNISTKEVFIKTLQSEYEIQGKSFENKIDKIMTHFSFIDSNSKDNMSSINSLLNQMDKIEENNHKEEIKSINMNRLFILMKDLVNDLDPGKEQSLTRSEFKSKSEILITKAALNRFVDFFLSSKKIKLKLEIVKECKERIYDVCSKITNNFSNLTRKYITEEALFLEFNFLKGCKDLKYIKAMTNIIYNNKNQLPYEYIMTYGSVKDFKELLKKGYDFSNLNVKAKESTSKFDCTTFYHNINKLSTINRLRKNTGYLSKFLRERKIFTECFFIIFAMMKDKTSDLFSNKSKNLSVLDNLDFNKENIENKMHKLAKIISTIDSSSLTSKELDYCEEQLVKSIRDSIIKEVNSLIFLWEGYMEINLFSSDHLDIYLFNDELLYFDISKTNMLFLVKEFSKFLTTLILNIFFTIDSGVFELSKYFDTTRKRDIQTNKFLSNTSISIITDPVLKILKKYFDKCMEKNILIIMVIYNVLFSLKLKIQKEIINDNIFIKIGDILNNSGNLIIDETEESILFTESSSKVLGISKSKQTEINENDFFIDDIKSTLGNRISLSQTKLFIDENCQYFSKKITEFMIEQNQAFNKYKIDVRYVGVIPLIKKTINFIHILIALIGKVKSDFLIETIENLIKNCRDVLEITSKSKEKYTNIVLMENYYFMLRFFNSFNSDDINFGNTGDNLLRELKEVFIFRRDSYLKENFSHFYESFFKYYNELLFQFDSLKGSEKLLKLQNNFIFEKLDKQVNSFLKNLYKEGIIDIAKRVYKHFNKENLLTSDVWKDTKSYIFDIIEKIDEIYFKCYENSIDKDLKHSIYEKFEKVNIETDFKDK